MYILIADSGSTKTDWTLLNDGKIVMQMATQGINPFHQSEDEIRSVLKMLSQVHQELSKSTFSNLNIYFYGSGLRLEFKEFMRNLLSDEFLVSKHVFVHSDLLGAAVALCGSEEGIASILGTGANSGLYDGQRIVQNTPPLGYVLGDEGSGAVLGTRFLNALLKGRLSVGLREAFFEQFQMTEADVVARVYRQPLANRWLASLSPFIHDHVYDPDIQGIVVDNFRDFFRNNIVPYGRRDLPVGAVGSVAWFYRRELAEAARLEGFTLGTVLRSPMDGLINYFSKQ